jgi:hypothetical protein
MRLTEKRAGRQAHETARGEIIGPKRRRGVDLTASQRIIFTTTLVVSLLSRFQTAHACVIGLAMCAGARSKIVKMVYPNFA